MYRPFSVATDVDEHSAVVSVHRQHQQMSLLMPDVLLYNLLEHPLHCLMWTNYDYDTTYFEAGIRFYEDVIGPRLDRMGGKLEYLELVLNGTTTHGTTTHGMGHRLSNGWRVGGGACDLRNALPTLSKNPAQAMYGAMNMLTQLEAAHTSILVIVHSPELSASLGISGGETMPTVDGYTYSFHLPALRALKATLNNTMFLILSYNPFAKYFFISTPMYSLSESAANAYSPIAWQCLQYRSKL